MAEVTVERTLNGIDVEALRASIQQIADRPELGSFRFRCSNEWVHGGHNRTRIGDFHGVGAEQRRREPFELEADEPPVLLGQDLAPNPVEYLLEAITACVTSSIVYHAAARGIEIRALSSKTEGDIDVRGFLGLDDTVPRGFQRIRITFALDADGTPEQLDEIIALGPAFSPVFDTVTRAVPVEVRRGT
jgi:uncharacterized OsmC-like protein